MRMISKIDFVLVVRLAEILKSLVSGQHDEQELVFAHLQK